jgi:hypothetical protein
VASTQNAHNNEWYGPAARARRRWERGLNQYMITAGRQAVLAGTSWIGTEHALLALIAPGERSVAARALTASGIEYEPLFKAVQRLAEAPQWPGRRRHGPPQQNPAFYVLHGRAEGFAAAQDAKAIGPEHLLLALLYSQGVHSRLIDQFSSGRKVLRTLGKLGAPVPRRLPPAADDIRWGERVWFKAPQSDAWGLASLVQRLLPDGAPFGFNFSDTDVMFHTGEGIDLKPIIRRARRQQLRQKRRDTTEPAPRRPT